MEPSGLTLLAARIWATAPTVPDEPRACFQRGCAAWRENWVMASSSSAPAATCAARKASAVKRPSGKKRIERLTLPIWKDSAASGCGPRPRIISVDRPPMSMTRRGSSAVCSRATPA